MTVRLNGPYTQQNTSGLQFRGLPKGVVPVSSGAWVRNPSWLSITAPASNEQKMVALFAVYNVDNNVVAFSASGAYTVDWGDGNTENVAAGVTAEHKYTYSNANLANTNAPVTFTASTDTVNRTGHGYTDGMAVQFFDIVTTTGITEGAVYYVINAAANSFKISTTPGGSAVDLVGDGSANLLPYKQAIITVTMQAGQTLTALNLNVRHSETIATYNTPYLDIALAGASLTDLRMGVANPGSTTQDTILGTVERVNIVNSNMKACSFLFNNMYSLQNIVNFVTSSDAARTLSVTLTDAGDLVTANSHGLNDGDPVFFTSITSTTGITTFTIYYVINKTTNTFQISATRGGAAVALTTDGSGSISVGTVLFNLFNACRFLRSVPLFNTASVTNMNNMFQSCPSLTSVPLFNTASVTTMTSMFSNCSTLTSVPLFNTASVTNMNAMFSNCSTLTSVPLFNTASVTTMTSMFQNCSTLTSVPLFNTASVTTMVSMFSGCTSLTSVPLFNTASVTDMNSMVNGCRSLLSVPLFNTASVTNMNSMFSGCTSLTSVPLFNTVSVTNMQSMFQSCTSLTSVPLFNTASVTNMISMFQSCTSLTSVPLFNTASVTNMNAMFQNCFSLTSVPLFNTVSVTNMTSMFQNCTSLTSVPLFNTASVTNMDSMFSGCFCINYIPALSTTALTTSGSLFINCRNLTKINMTNFKQSLAMPNTKMSKTNLEAFFKDALAPAIATAKTLSITGSYGVDNVITLAATTGGFSTTVTMTDTTGLTVGMFVTGTGIAISDNIPVTSDVTANTLTLASHNIPNGTKISFTALGTTTGISLYTVYYVVNATTNTFQVAATAGGAAIDLTGTNSSSLTVKWGAVISSIVPNTSITLSAPTAGAGSTSLSFRKLDSTEAMLKNWTVAY